VYRKDLRRDDGNPLLLRGYGSYGYSYALAFQLENVSLLDRGWIVARTHVRGGSEMGRAWYEQGRMLNKKNTFTDFIACAETLCRQGYTTPERTAMVGGSAGGLLIGAVLNMRPDQFGAAIAAVPFVDVINTMLDETIPLTVPEYEQWGNPHQKEYYDYMRSYSPYDNVTPQAYPPLMVITGVNDSAVQYWEPAKWVAKLRANRTDKNPLLLHINFGAGHAGASGRYDELREAAFEYAFLLDTIK
jgi:oligopeptidase B